MEEVGKWQHVLMEMGGWTQIFVFFTTRSFDNYHYCLLLPYAVCFQILVTCYYANSIHGDLKSIILTNRPFDQPYQGCPTNQKVVGLIPMGLVCASIFRQKEQQICVLDSIGIVCYSCRMTFNEELCCRACFMDTIK